MLFNVPTDKRRCPEFLGEPIDNSSTIGVRKCVFRSVLRRHLRLADRAEDFTPTFNVRTGQKIRVQLVDAKPALGFLGTMTGKATLLENGLHGLAKSGDVRSRNGVAGSRSGLCGRLFQEPGFSSPVFPCRFKADWSLLTISSQPRTRDSKDEQADDCGILHGLHCESLPASEGLLRFGGVDPHWRTGGPFSGHAIKTKVAIHQSLLHRQ